MEEKCWLLTAENESSLEVNISNFSPSIYFIKMNDGVFKFIKN